MRWEDERYVRLYTRDTADWMALSWDAQALLMQLLRKVDRSGALALGRHGKRAVALVLNQGAAWDRIEPALAELEADGCVRISGDILFIRNFLAAQESRTTDAMRKREQRARDAARLADVASQPVTSGHEPSPEVTPAVPSRAVPNHPAVTEKPVVGPRADERPPGGLRDALEATWLKRKGVAYRWRPVDDDAVRQLLCLSGDDWALVDRVLNQALDMTFPLCRGLKDLAEHWNVYAGKRPEPPRRNGRATEADKDHSLDLEPF